MDGSGERPVRSGGTESTGVLVCTLGRQKTHADGGNAFRLWREKNSDVSVVFSVISEFNFSIETVISPKIKFRGKCL